MDKKISDIIEWDVVNWSRALDFWEKNTQLDLTTASGIELGSRHGGLSLWLALKGAHVKCTDLDGPTELAVEKHKRYAVAHLIDYEAMDATNIPFSEKFDLIIFKSMLGQVGWENHAEKQNQAIKSIFSALKPGGELFFVENLIGSPLHQFFRRTFIPWGTRWRYVTRNEMLLYFAPFSEVKYEMSGFLGAFGRNEQQRSILGKIDNQFANSLVPEEWKYIMIGIAKK